MACKQEGAEDNGTSEATSTTAPHTVPTTPDSTTTETTLEEILNRHFADVPPVDWDSLPADLIDRLDYYACASMLDE